jgi:hypothetical protein
VDSVRDIEMYAAIERLAEGWDHIATLSEKVVMLC